MHFGMGFDAWLLRVLLSCRMHPASLQLARGWRIRVSRFGGREAPRHANLKGGIRSSKHGAKLVTWRDSLAFSSAPPCPLTRPPEGFSQGAVQYVIDCSACPSSTSMCRNGTLAPAPFRAADLRHRQPKKLGGSWAGSVSCAGGAVQHTNIGSHKTGDGQRGSQKALHHTIAAHLGGGFSSTA